MTKLIHRLERQDQRVLMEVLESYISNTGREIPDLDTEIRLNSARSLLLTLESGEDFELTGYMDEERT